MATAQAGHRYTLSGDVMAAGLNASAFGGGATICAQWPAPPFFGDYLGSGPSGWTNWTTVSLQNFIYPASKPPLRPHVACEGRLVAPLGLVLLPALGMAIERET